MHCSMYYRPGTSPASLIHNSRRVSSVAAPEKYVETANDQTAIDSGRNTNKKTHLLKRSYTAYSNNHINKAQCLPISV